MVVYVCVNQGQRPWSLDCYNSQDRRRMSVKLSAQTYAKESEAIFVSSLAHADSRNSYRFLVIYFLVIHPLQFNNADEPC